jgi:HSP90 family molecular chaperone
VLIQPKSKLILPDWLRFVKGVVDSEDIPLNISRENMQDSSLIARIKNVLVRRIIRWLDELSKVRHSSLAHTSTAHTRSPCVSTASRSAPPHGRKVYNAPL